MCGIAGIYYHGGVDDSDVNQVKNMLKKIHHRGPDGQGLWSDDQVVLGHALLAIIGVGTGYQPMSNETNTIWVTFNGEIYNHRELRISLEKKGHIFKTKTDTEVLVHLYEEYGEALVHQLNGMFAFGIWDQEEKKLVLCRDRLGVKPIFVAKNGNKFFFASELKALKISDASLGNFDPQAILNYLRFKHVGADRSIYSDVLKVPPAHIVTIKKDKLECKRYWTPCSRKNITEDHRYIRESIRDATKIRLRSDVPLSISLSGGLDSSIVLYEAVTGCAYKGETFSIGYPNQSEDESSTAMRFSHEMGIKNNIIEFVDINTDFLPDLASIMDEPFGDYSAYPSYLLFREMSKFSTVVLTGDGGDEAFGGYMRYARSIKYNQYLKFISILRKVLPTISFKLFPKNLQTVLKINPLNASSLYSEILAIDSQSSLMKMFQIEFLEYLDCYQSKYAQSNASIDNTLLNLESTLDYLEYLPGDVLAKVDMTSMHSSVEARSPLLDYRIAELGLSIHPSRRVRKNQTKILLRDAYKGLLPDYIIAGSKKGFGLPSSYMNTDNFKNYARQLLLDNSQICNQIFFKDALENYISTAFKGNQLNLKHIWNLVMLENWFILNKH